MKISGSDHRCGSDYQTWPVQVHPDGGQYKSFEILDDRPELYADPLPGEICYNQCDNAGSMEALSLISGFQIIQPAQDSCSSLLINGAGISISETGIPGNGARFGITVSEVS